MASYARSVAVPILCLQGVESRHWENAVLEAVPTQTQPETAVRFQG